MMQIALTKKLADGMKIKPGAANTEANPLFTWTANWVKTWDNRRTEDMLVLVNNATRFAVVVYQVKRKDLKNIEGIIQTAISNTLAAINIHPGVIEEYLEQAGEIEFVKNSNRKATSWVNRAAQDSTAYVAHQYNRIDEMYNDTIGTIISDGPVNVTKLSESFYPDEKMVRALSELTGKSAYNYKAFELLITLDLEVYQVTRRIIVPAHADFYDLHKILQSVFDWENYHLYDFTVLGESILDPVERLVPFEEALEFDSGAALMGGHTLAEYFPKYSDIIYRYDLGDNWEHHIELVRVIEEHDEEAPYLLEAAGQTPPEDVGGTGGFSYFYEVISDSKHPEHQQMREWSSFWTPELPEQKKKPRVMNYSALKYRVSKN